MRLKTRFKCFCLFILTIQVFGQQRYFPRGVAGAEVWYITGHTHLPQNSFPNVFLSSSINEVKKCNLTATASLFNFNESFQAQSLCLIYNSPLENTTSRNVFFVGEPLDPAINSSHLTTGWNASLGNTIVPDSIIRNRFDVANNLSYVNKKTFSYQSNRNANVNFYNWNQFQVDKKLKSYGFDGESSFYIGKSFTNNAEPAQYFSGNFPEFISFPFELTDNQKNRVESYLALKYGLTLSDDVNYRNSKNLIFWRQINNKLFRERIFGIGRDNISGLNQLQSQSTHLKNFLVASVGELLEKNTQKQEKVEINNNSFIVFGDNDKALSLGAKNQFNIYPLDRVWLSQKTGVCNPHYKLVIAVKQEMAGWVSGGIYQLLQ